MNVLFDIETFRNIGNYELMSLSQKTPSCFNGRLSILKYRVTVEQITESDEVIRARIQKLWDECDNHHHRSVLIQAGKEYGLELK
jgi:hypothetical protein